MSALPELFERSVKSKKDGSTIHGDVLIRKPKEEATTLATGFDESKHPRGQPENAGEFAEKDQSQSVAPIAPQTKLTDEQKSKLAKLASDVKGGSIGKRERKELAEKVIGANANQQLLHAAITHIQWIVDEPNRRQAEEATKKQKAAEDAAADMPEEVFEAIRKAHDIASNDGSFSGASSDDYPDHAREAEHGFTIVDLIEELRNRDIDLSSEADPDDVRDAVYDILSESSQAKHDQWENSLPPEGSAERVDATRAYRDIRSHVHELLRDLGADLHGGSWQSDSTYWRLPDGFELRVANHPSGVSAVSSPDAEIRVDKLHSSEDVKKAISEVAARYERYKKEREEDEQDDE